MKKYASNSILISALIACGVGIFSAVSVPPVLGAIADAPIKKNTDRQENTNARDTGDGSDSKENHSTIQTSPAPTGSVVGGTTSQETTSQPTEAVTETTASPETATTQPSATTTSTQENDSVQQEKETIYVQPSDSEKINVPDDLPEDVAVPGGSDEAIPVEVYKGMDGISYYTDGDPVPVEGISEDITVRKSRDVSDSYMYVVQPGDTLQIIANKCSMDINTIMKANGISDVSAPLTVGSVLTIPARGDGKG